jgi:hypothetical protein
MKPMLLTAALVGLAACAAPEFPRRAPAETAGGALVAQGWLDLDARDLAVSPEERARLAALVAPAAGAPAAQATVIAPPAARRRAERIGAALTDSGAAVAYLVDPGADRVRVAAERRELAAALCPDWTRARLRHPIDPVRGNPTPADDLALGCSVQTSIDAMAARPGDLTAPAETTAPRGAAYLRPVERHRTTGPVALPEPFRADDGL